MGVDIQYGKTTSGLGYLTPLESLYHWKEKQGRRPCVTKVLDEYRVCTFCKGAKNEDYNKYQSVLWL